MAEAGSIKIAGDAENTRGIRPVRRQIDFDQRIVEAGPLRIERADRRIGGQIENAIVIVRKFKLGAGAQHARRFDAADDALAQRNALGRNIGAGRREDGFHPGPRVRRAADDLHRRSGADLDEADAQAIGIGMLARLDHLGDDEILQRRGGIMHMLDLEADLGQGLDDRGKVGLRLEMLLQPAQSKFHESSGSARGLRLR